MIAALEGAEARIRERIGRVGAAPMEAARTGDGFWTLKAHAFEVDVMHASEATPAASGMDRSLLQNAQWLLVPRFGLFAEPSLVPRIGPLIEPKRGARLAPDPEGPLSTFKTAPETGRVTNCEDDDWIALRIQDGSLRVSCGHTICVRAWTDFSMCWRQRSLSGTAAIRSSGSFAACQSMYRLIA